MFYYFKKLPKNKLLFYLLNQRLVVALGGFRRNVSMLRVKRGGFDIV